MKIKAVRELHLLNRWITLIKTLDSRALRIMRANLQLIPKLFTASSPFLFAIGPRYHVDIPVLHSSVEYAMHIGATISWKEIADHPGTCSGNQEERTEDLRVIILMRTVSLRKLSEELQRLHLRFSDIYELMSFTDQHKRSFVSGTLLTFVKSPQQDQYNARAFRLILTAKKGHWPNIDLSQALTFARKTDNMPLVKAGSMVLVTQHV